MVSSKVVRVTNGSLPAQFGPDCGRRIVLTFIPGDGKGIADLIALRPLGTRRSETVSLLDVYNWALRCRVNRTVLEKARERKAKKAVRLAAQRQARAER